MPSTRPAFTASAVALRTWCGSAYTVVACSPRASGVPSWSKIVPRPAGRTMGVFVCDCAIDDSADARTVASHASRTSSTPNVRTMQRSRNRMREFATPPISLAGVEVEVARICPRRGPEAEAVCHLLDPLRSACARELRRERRVLLLQLELLLIEPADVDVRTEHGDVHGDDASEQQREEQDPEDAAAQPSRLRAATWSDGRRRARAPRARRRRRRDLPCQPLE